VAGPRPAPWKPLPAQPVDREPLPAQLVGLVEQHGVAIVALRREALESTRRSSSPACGAATWPRCGKVIRRQKRVAGSPKSGAKSNSWSMDCSITWTTVARRFVASGEAPVVQHGQQLDGRGARFGVVGRLNHRLAEALQPVGRPIRQIAHVGKEARHIARLQLFPNPIGRRILARLDAPRSHRTVPPSSFTSRPNLSVQASRLPPFPSAPR